MTLCRITECWLESGLLTTMGRPSGSPSPATVTSPAGPRVPHRVAQSERVGAVVRHRRVRQDLGDQLVATDARDLLRDVGLDDQVASPGRDRRDDDLGPPGIDVERLRGPGERDARAG